MQIEQILQSMEKHEGAAAGLIFAILAGLIIVFSGLYYIISALRPSHTYYECDCECEGCTE